MKIQKKFYGNLPSVAMSEARTKTAPLPSRSSADTPSRGSTPSKIGKYGSLKPSSPSGYPQHVSSSTSTLKTDGDIGMKKPSTLLRSVCLLLRFYIAQGQVAEKPILINAFSEVRYPLV